MDEEIGEDRWSWIEDSVPWVPPPVDTSRPSIARIYDYWLGGKDNYAVDREAAEAIARTDPGGPAAAQANRRFLVEAVESMCGAGIRQFIDLGAGIPTSPNVYEIARAVHPDAKVVSVDNDPVVLANHRASDAGPQVAVLSRDIRRPDSIMNDPAVRALLDLSRPVGLLMISVLHFVDVATAPTIIARYLRDLAPGSMLAICAASNDGADPEVVARTRAAYAAAPLVFRTTSEIEALFDGLDMVRPVGEIHRLLSGVSLGGIGVKGPVDDAARPPG